MTVKNNNAGGNISGAGGGLSLADSVALYNSGKLTVEGNTAHKGAGIYAADNVALNFNSTQSADITNNRASQNGGGIHMMGNLVKLNIGSNGVVNITKNNATSNGGGVFVNRSATFTLSNGAKLNMGGTALGNTAQNGAGVYNNNSASLLIDGGVVNFTENRTTINGGAIYNSTSAVLTINSSSVVDFIKNHAGSNGGGIYNSGTLSTINGGLVNFTENTATSNGGGVYNNATLRMTNSVVNLSKNSATDGGGIYNNSAVSVIGGSVEFRENVANANGGGLYLNNGQLDVQTGALMFAVSNQATKNGGGIYMNGGKLNVQQDTSTFLLSNIAVEKGGGIAATGSASITNPGLNSDKSFIVQNNVATDGGGIAQLSGTLTISTKAKGMNINGNTATKDGGGIWSAGTITLTSPVGSGSGVTAISLNTNKANRGGGAYLAPGSQLNAGSALQGMEIIGNTSDTNGGGVYLDSTTNANGGKFTSEATLKVNDNKAPSGDGGGFYVHLGDVKETGVSRYNALALSNKTTFLGNSARDTAFWDTNNTCSDFERDAAVIYRNKIFATTYTILTGTKQFQNAYNNYDINFEADALLLTLTLRKVDAQDFNIRLPGAKFNLYQCSNTTPGHQHSSLVTSSVQNCWDLTPANVRTATSNAQGLFTFEDLIPGSDYQLVETQVPNGGYQLPSGQWRISIDQSGNITPTAVGGNVLAFAQPGSGDNEADFLVLNALVNDLPLLGGTGTTPYIILGCSLLLIGGAAIWSLYRNKRRYS